MLSVEMRDLEPGDDGMKVVEATQVHRILIGCAPRVAEHLNPAMSAEEMLRRPRIELVDRERFLAAQDPEALRRDAVIDHAFLGADRAVALRSALHLRFDAEAHPLAVAPALIGFHVSDLE